MRRDEKSGHTVETKEVFGLPVYAKGRASLLEDWAKVCEEKQTKQSVFFVNAHTINTMHEEKDFQEVLRGADWLLPDGIGIELAVRASGGSLEENLCGTDLALDICRHRYGFRIFLVGGSRGIAEAAGKRFAETYNGQIVGTHHGFLLDADERELSELWEKIAASQADMVWVGMGVPLQERWVREHRALIEAPLVLAVGGLFDYYAGSVRRAPSLWRKARMEWAYRLFQEPKRLWKRYLLGNPLFLLRTFRWLVAKDR